MIPIRHPISEHKLAVFAEVVRQGSITAAADRLNITQPAVSTIIKQIEKHFDVKLFDVIGKKIHLTPAARTLYDEWDSVKISIDNLHFKMNQFKEGTYGDIRIVMVSSGKYFVPLMIKEFLKDHPEIDFHCDIKRRDAVCESVRSYQYDVGILTNPPLESKLSTTYLFDNDLVFICHPNNPLAKSTSTNIKELAKQKFIIREETALITQTLFQIFHAHHLNIDIFIEIDSTEAVKQAVISDLGIALVPEISVATELQYGILKKICVKNIKPSNRWFLACNQRAAHLELIKHFINHMKYTKINITHFT